MGNIVMSAVSGGTIEFNSTKVRLIAYSGGSGNIPVLNTTISQGAASGKLLGVYQNLHTAPMSATSAMTAFGYIAIRQWNDVPFSGGPLVGITATATTADVAGWLEIVGVNATTATVNRLNTFKVRGDWYYFTGATTSGARATTYQIPSNGNITYAPGVWVETDTASNVYEFYPCAGNLTALSTVIATDELRGKVCWITTAGLVRFGHDGTNLTGGYLPPSGRRIRIPNVIFNNCLSTSLTTNVIPDPTLATRYDFTTNGGGNIDINKALLNWYPSFNQPYSVSLSAVGIMTQLLCTEIAAPINWGDIGVGNESGNTQISLSMATCFAGGTMDKCTWMRSAQAAATTYVVSFSDMDGFDITNEKSFSLVKAANATTGTHTHTRVANTTYYNTIMGGGRAFLTTCTNMNYSGSVYYDNPFRTTASALPMYTYDIGTNCANIVFDGLSFSGLTGVQPYNGILNIAAAGCSNIKLRNLGTYNAPLDLGAARRDGIAWIRVTTLATITSAAHGLTTGDIIYVIVSSSIAAITVSTKTVTVVDANSFTFAALNAGALTGTLSYYLTMSANLFVLAAGAAANTVKIQRCYTPHTRTNLYTSDNSSKNIILENVYGDFINIPLTPQLNGYHKGVGSIPSLAAQTSCYGTHWFDFFTTENATGVTSMAWDRTTTTASATSVNHGLRTGDFVVINTSSDTSAIILGQKTITVFTKDMFTFTCLNAGAASGTLSFDTLSGRIGLLMNEATSDTSDEYIIMSGATAFTSAGGLYMPNFNDEIIFETPEYIIGHETFPIAEPIMAGGVIGNHDITYCIDKNNGSGYSSYKNLMYQISGGVGVSSSAIITMSGRSTSAISIGDYVWGTNVAPNAKVTGITNYSAVTVDKVNIGTVSGTLRFSYLGSETGITASNGFKFRTKFRTQIANFAAITSLYWYTESSSTSRAYKYPLDPVEVDFTLDTLQIGSEIRIYRTSDDVELAGTESSTTAFTYSYTYIGEDTPIYIRIIHLNYEWLTYETLILSNENQTIPVQQRIDRNYANTA